MRLFFRCSATRPPVFRSAKSYGGTGRSAMEKVRRNPAAAQTPPKLALLWRRASANRCGGVNCIAAPRVAQKPEKRQKRPNGPLPKRDGTPARRYRAVLGALERDSGPRGRDRELGRPAQTYPHLVRGSESRPASAGSRRRRFLRQSHLRRGNESLLQASFQNGGPKRLRHDRAARFGSRRSAHQCIAHIVSSTALTPIKPPINA